MNKSTEQNIKDWQVMGKSWDKYYLLLKNYRKKKNSFLKIILQSKSYRN